jgi:hypothetical protein
MKSKLLLGLSSLLLLAVSGCGTDNKEGSSQSASFKASSACIECHAVSLISPVTGVAIVTEWQRGAHNTKNGASCPDCHAVNGHPASGVLPDIPGAAICVKCHTALTMQTYAAHFNASQASYLGAKNIATALANPVMTGHTNACLGCHNPHDNSTLLPVNEVYADSAHGAVADDAFSEQVFIGNANCNRCHTGTGFRYYMTTGNQTAISKATLGVYSTAREVIGCNACHTDYSFKRISSDPNVAFATFSTPYLRFANVKKSFPTDVGDTKLCIPCHAGRSGRTGASVSSATNSPTDAHYFPAAGVMYGKIAFIAFTSQSAALPAVDAVTTAPVTGAIAATTYGKTLITSDDLSGGVTSTHRKLGTAAIHGDSHNPTFFVAGNLDSGGPCVVCHMSVDHSLKITPATFDKVCVNCHTSERGLPLTRSNFLEAFVDENRVQMNDSLSLAVKLLENNYDITVQLLDIEAPQEATFLRKSTNAAINWTTFTTDVAGNTLTAAQLTKLKGAMINVAICYKENAAFVHARSLTRRIIYDSIDFLDNGAMDQSAGFTAVNLMPTVFKKGATAFTDSTLTALNANTTPSMTFLIGFDRSTGSWTLRERP